MKMISRKIPNLIMFESGIFYNYTKYYTLNFFYMIFVFGLLLIINRFDYKLCWIVDKYDLIMKVRCYMGMKSKVFTLNLYLGSLKVITLLSTMINGNGICSKHLFSILLENSPIFQRSSFYRLFYFLISYILKLYLL